MIGIEGKVVLSYDKVLSKEAVLSASVSVVSLETRPPVTRTMSGEYTLFTFVNSS